MGRRADQVSPELAGRLAYPVLSDAQGCAALLRPWVQPTRPPETMLPQEVAAHVLRHLLERAEAHLLDSRAPTNPAQSPTSSADVPFHAQQSSSASATTVTAGAGVRQLYPLLQVVQEAVITVPAHFGPAARTATVEAGLMAGLTRVELLQEPVAAAMAYGFGTGGHMATGSYATLLVFDLGGGTLDVSLLEGWDGILEVLVTDGDDELGGDDLTRALAELLLHRAGYGRMSSLPEPARLALTQLAEHLKLSLGQPGTAGGVMLPSTLMADGRAAPAEAQVSQKDVKQAWAPLLARLWSPLERLAHASHLQFEGVLPLVAQQQAPGAGALHNTALPVPHAGPTTSRAGSATTKVLAEPHQMFAPSQAPSGEQPLAGRYQAPPRRLTGLVLVGAATRTPAVHSFITQVCGLQPAEGADPEEVVALGAALQAGVLSGLVGRGAELTDGSYIASEHGRATGWRQQHEEVRVEWTP